MKTAKSVSISWNRTINWLWFNFHPLLFAIFIEKTFDSLFQNCLTRYSSIDVNSILLFAVSNIVSWTTGWIILHNITNVNMDQVFRFMIIPSYFWRTFIWLLQHWSLIYLLVVYFFKDLIRMSLKHLVGIFLRNLWLILDFFLTWRYSPISCIGWFVR